MLKKFLAIVYLVFGFTIAGCTLAEVIDLSRYDTVANGEVVETIGAGGYMYPVYRYITTDGILIERDRLGFREGKEPEIGDVIEIRYSEEDNHDVTGYRVSLLWFILPALLSLLFIFLGVRNLIITPA